MWQMRIHGLKVTRPTLWTKSFDGFSSGALGNQWAYLKFEDSALKRIQSVGFDAVSMPAASLNSKVSAGFTEEEMEFESCKIPHIPCRGLGESVNLEHRSNQEGKCCPQDTAEESPISMFVPSRKPKMDVMAHGLNRDERWQFLKQLPHKLIRDIGFVISSPSILIDSFELPTVCSDMLGGSSSNWPESAKWLMMLEVDEVRKWFEAKIKNGRLGDHFAFCVEYVLRFSPVVQAKRLLISQQVLHRVHKFSLEVPIPVDKATLRYDRNSSSPVEELEISPKIRVELLGSEVLIKFYGSIDQNTSTEELTISTVEQSSHGLHTSAFKAGNVFQDFWSLRLQDEQETCEKVQVGALFRSTTNGTDCLPEASKNLGKRKRKLLRKLQRLKDGKGSTLTIGEFDFLFQLDDTVKQVSFSEDICPQRSSDMTKQTLWKDSLGTNQKVNMQSRQDLEEINVNHWEVSVKFLLYAGPWELFGLETPSYATWKNKNQDFQEGSPVFEVNAETTLGEGDSNCNISTETSEAGCGCAMKDAWHMNEFLACFLGPHIGETLYNRKTRLSNQLSLSHNLHAASLLCRLFDFRSNENENTELCSDKQFFVEKTPAEKLMCTPEYNVCTLSESSCTSQNEQVVEMGIERLKVMRVSPRALLKGYLFYEYDLWCHLCQNGEYGCNRHLIQNEFLEDDSSAECFNKDDSNCEDKKACSGEVMKNATQLQHANRHSKSRLNPKHWLGWWTHVSNFAKFALSSAHEHSRWYIVPKKEWLSPVVVEEEDEGVVRKVLNVDEFLAMAAKVAEEAETLQIPRKRRFMISEMMWVSQEPVHSSELTCDSSKQQTCFNMSVASHGKWVEVSRGFVVEDTWPDSRLCLPHGYKLCWSPEDTQRKEQVTGMLDELSHMQKILQK